MQNSEYKKIVYFICIIAALGGLLFGLDQGFIANSLDTIEHVYGLTYQQGESYAAILAVGGIVGALSSGVFARFLGRKKSLVFAGFLFTSLSLISAFLPPLSILTACRFGLGFAVGVASFIVPLYLSETAPTKIRGTMGTLFQMMITVGILLIAVTNVIIAHMFTKAHVALPLMFLVIALFAAVMFIGTFILPPSPRWLMLQGKKEDAINVLKTTLSSDAEVNLEIREIEQALATESQNKAGFGVVFKGYFFKLLIMGVLIQMFQQLVGINTMIYYAPTIFGYASLKGLVASLTVPIVNVLFTLPALRWVEKWGRKKLLYVGTVTMFFSLIAAAIAFHSIDAVPHGMMVPHWPKVVLLIAVIVYIFGFASSWGPVAWLLCAEVFPLKGREVGMTITTIVNWTFAGIVMAQSLTIMHKYGNSSIFLIFAGFCLLALFFLKFFVPETKGVTLEEIEMNIKSGKKLRDIGAS